MLTDKQLKLCAKDPAYAALHEAELQAMAAAKGFTNGNAAPPKNSARISPKLAKLNDATNQAEEDNLLRVVPTRWRVTVKQKDETEVTEPDGTVRRVGYMPVLGPVSCQLCVPDVLTHIQRAGIEGPVMLEFATISGDDSFEFETAIEPEAEPTAAPRALSPNAGLPEMMAMFMAQQERQAQMLVAAVAKMTEKSSAAEKEWQRKLDERDARHRQEIQDLLNRAQASLDSDKKRQLGGNLEQMAYQAMGAATERMFANMLNPQAPVQQAPQPVVAGTPIQGLAQLVQGLKADQEAKEILARELPGLLGGAKAPEPSLMDQVTQLVPVFMLLKNMSGKSGADLETAMQSFMRQRGAGTSPPVNVNPITGMPIPDAMPQDGDAALQQLAANMGQ
jgi:hypothetical protein